MDASSVRRRNVIGCCLALQDSWVDENFHCSFDRSLNFGLGLVQNSFGQAELKCERQARLRCRFVSSPASLSMAIAPVAASGSARLHSPRHRIPGSLSRRSSDAYLACAGFPFPGIHSLFIAL